MYFLLAVKSPHVIDGEQKCHGSLSVDTAPRVEGRLARRGPSVCPGTCNLARKRREKLGGSDSPIPDELSQN